MPRRDLTAERTEQILDAFERCIVKHGLEGSSLEKIGEEAGMKRTILRHYIGNREDLIQALCRRVVARYRSHMASLEQLPASKNPVKTLLDNLFAEYTAESAADILVAESLIAAADRHPGVGGQMRDYMADFTATVSRLLERIHPKSAESARWTAAYGITSLLFNDASLIALSLPAKYRKAARACARNLIDGLERA